MDDRGANAESEMGHAARQGGGNFAVTFPSTPNVLAPRQYWTLTKTLTVFTACLITLMVFRQFVDYPWGLNNLIVVALLLLTLRHLRRPTVARLSAFYLACGAVYLLHIYPIWIVASAVLGYDDLTPYPLNPWFMLKFLGNCSAALAILWYFNPAIRYGLSLFVKRHPPKFDIVRLGVIVVVGLFALAVPYDLFASSWKFGIHPTAAQQAVASGEMSPAESRLDDLRREARTVTGEYLPPTARSLAALLREKTSTDVPSTISYRQYSQRPDVPKTDLFGNPTDMQTSHWFLVTYCDRGTLYEWDVNPYSEVAYQKGIVINGDAC